MSESVTERLIRLLKEHNVQHELMRHEPVFTSEEAAQVRGTSLASGAKALICKADGEFLMVVLPADRRLASRQVRRQAGLRSLRFASRSEVLEITGLTPGSIPPFGSLFGLSTWCDRQMADQLVINFNAGDHSVSVSMRYTDFERVEQPRVLEVAE
jgi:Ala-tRNA(Pro) deacylase